MTIHRPWHREGYPYPVKDCPACKGEGSFETEYTAPGREPTHPQIRDVECEFCGGIGKVESDE